MIARNLSRMLLPLLSCAALTAMADALQSSDGYIREMPPGQTNSAAFMALSNDTAQPVALVAATSPAADRAEIHVHRQVDGAMRMERVPRVEVPAQGRLVLQPGGYHLMLIGLKQPLRAGDQVSVTLLDERGGAHPLRLPVVDVRADASATSDHQHHHQGD